MVMLIKYSNGLNGNALRVGGCRNLGNFLIYILVSILGHRHFFIIIFHTMVMMDGLITLEVKNFPQRF